MNIAFVEWDKEGQINWSSAWNQISQALVGVTPKAVKITEVGETGNDQYVAVVSSEYITPEQAQQLFEIYYPAREEGLGQEEREDSDTAEGLPFTPYFVLNVKMP